MDPGGLLRRFIPSAKARREEARVDASPGGRPLPLPPVSGQRTAGIPPIYMRRVHSRLPVHRPFLLTQLELPAPAPCLPGQRHQGPGGPAKSTRLLLPPPPFQTRPAATSSLLHAYAAPHPPRQPASQPERLQGCRAARGVGRPFIIRILSCKYHLENVSHLPRRASGRVRQTVGARLRGDDSGHARRLKRTLRCARSASALVAQVAWVAGGSKERVSRARGMGGQQWRRAGAAQRGDTLPQDGGAFLGSFG